jgi:glycosyltransferase involved in cell wall biosynthesis
MRFCFVLPRAGEGIAGGAEGLCRELAERLIARGDVVSIFTTCAVDNRTWENALPAGETVENGVRIERFPVDPRNLEAWVPLQIALHHGQRLSVDEEITWLKESVNSSSLFQALERNYNEFDFFIFAPYLFGTSIVGPHCVPGKAILLPCLHDESYAFMRVVAAAFRAARGCIFNAAAERRLAERLYGPLHGGVVGMGFDVVAEPPSKSFPELAPYLLYLGRKETGKGVHIALDYFVGGKESGKLPERLKFVVAGPGSFSDLERPAYEAREDIVDIGKLTEDEKRGLLRGALALVQSSGNESFSIVLMESWLQKRPVLVNAYCDVTREHVIDSNGGLFFGNQDEFFFIIQELLGSPDLGNLFGARGFDYVLSRYNWEGVLQRFDGAIEAIARSPADNDMRVASS